MLTNLIIASLLVLSNIFIHAYGLSIISHLHRNIFHNSHSAFIIALIVLGILFLHTIEVWVWAFYYLSADIFNTIEAALYYSTTTYTTVGFGDIIMNPDYRIIGAIESAVGILLFGWSAAYIFYALSNITNKK